MKKLNRDYINMPFSHIYVEESVRDHPRTQEILARLPSAKVICISHYKDVFCRSGQRHLLQHAAQSLILAANSGELLYPGSSVCQSFGNEYFYYTSCIRNCIYDCAYCYLKGMYPSANIVIFVNLEDYFERVAQILESHPLYLCVSYDTDLLALEGVVGYVGAWMRFAAGYSGQLKLEIRTKCANEQFFANRKPMSNVIFAFTLSPQAVVEAYEYGTPSNAQRLRCVAAALRAGFAVRLCFDPMIYIPDWQSHYDVMLAEVFDRIPMGDVVDVSIGSFRISQDYLKNMRRQEPECAAVWFPYQKENGFYHYPRNLMGQMEQFLVERIKEKMPKEKIFLWND